MPRFVGGGSHGAAVNGATYVLGVFGLMYLLGKLGAAVYAWRRRNAAEAQAAKRRAALLAQARDDPDATDSSGTDDDFDDAFKVT